MCGVITLDVRLSQAVEDVKAQLKKQMNGAFNEKMQLWYGERILENGNSLSFYKVEQSYFLTLKE